jgi:hypothetical protein
MASTILVNTINTQSGNTITIPTGKTLAVTDTGALTIGGTAITTGSSNILRKTADYTILEADVSGKSELVIATNAASATRTITLPAVATTGLANCIVTIICDADATSTYKLLVQDSATAEVWTGYQTGDFVRLIVSNSVWVVVDHKETMFSSRFPVANQTISTGALEKMTGNSSGWTSITDSGNMWNTTDVRLVMPFDCYAQINYTIKPGPGNQWRATPALKAGTAGSPTTIADGGYTGTAGEYGGGLKTLSTTVKLSNAEVIEFWARNCQSNGTGIAYGAYVDMTRFDVTVTRVY